MKSETPDPLEQWAQKLAAALSVFRAPHDFLSPPPGGGSAQDRLSILLAVWRAAGVQGNLKQPIAACAREWSGRADARDAVFELLKTSLSQIERGIGDALAAGACSADLVSAADFGAGLSRMQSPHLSDVHFVVGRASALPAAHPLLTAIPTDDRLVFDGHGCFVLGPMEPHLNPRAFYVLTDVAALTVEFRQQQKQREEERAERDRREIEEQQRRFWASPDGQAELQNRRLKALHAADKIPAEPTLAPPAVRIGR